MSIPELSQNHLRMGGPLRLPRQQAAVSDRKLFFKPKRSCFLISAASLDFSLQNGQAAAATQAVEAPVLFSLGLLGGRIEAADFAQVDGGFRDQFLDGAC